MKNYSNSKYQRERRAQWKKQGLCIGCGGSRDSYQLKCERCREKTISQGHQKRQERNKKGICAGCGKKPVRKTGAWYCEECNKKHASYAEKNKESIKQSQRRFVERVRMELIQAYGGKCVCCGEAEPTFLELDHINNDGAKDRKIQKGTGFYVLVKKMGYPKDRFQLLCRNCNYSKWRNHGTCIHKTKGETHETNTKATQRESQGIVHKAHE